MKFTVVDRLAVTVILGGDYCYKHVREFNPRQRIVALDDETTVSILCNPSPSTAVAIPLQKQQEYIPSKRRNSNKVQVTTKTTLQPESHNWVAVKTYGKGLVNI